MGRILMRGALAAALLALSSGPAFAGSPAQGAKVFASQCSACHGNRANSPQAVGPRLFGVVGRHAGTSPGYVYSPAMKGSGLVWTTDQLKVYLKSPAKVVHGTKMPYSGLNNPAQLEDLLAYLATLH
ncbi:cytochrome c family protein [Novosphingobium sp.]|uniref:c-type cytochrome n=1 Tax=Novosphingobium sp. TaxID=1874826 RepID=UPI0035B4F02C